MSRGHCDTTRPAISLIVISLNEGPHLKKTVDNLLATSPAGSEILVVDDGSDDGSTESLAHAPAAVRVIHGSSLGVARARNFGASLARGDVFLFADAHISMPEDWASPLLEALAEPGVGAVAPAISDWQAAERCGFGLRLTGPDLDARWLARRGHLPYEVPILPGCCLAMRRSVFEATGGFDGGLISRGGVDNELGVRMWLLGYRMLVVPELTVGHLFRRSSPYPVRWSTYLHNRLRLALLHLSQPRIERVCAALASHDAFPAALQLAQRGDAETRRSALASCRLHDDDWLFDRFGFAW